jgi:hypothetical protein
VVRVIFRRDLGKGLDDGPFVFLQYLETTHKQYHSTQHQRHHSTETTHKNSSCGRSKTPEPTYTCFLRDRTSRRALASLSWYRAHQAYSSCHALIKKYENSVETPKVAMTATKVIVNTCLIGHLL